MCNENNPITRSLYTINIFTACLFLRFYTITSAYDTALKNRHFLSTNRQITFMCGTTQQTQDVESMLASRVVYGGPTTNRHCFNVLCLLAYVFCMLRHDSENDQTILTYVFHYVLAYTLFIPKGTAVIYILPMDSDLGLFVIS